MKKTLFFLLVALTFVSCFRVPPGHEGLKVNVLGSERGDIEQYPTEQGGTPSGTYSLLLIKTMCGLEILWKAPAMMKASPSPLKG
jgi:hypothetical protein